MMDLGCGHRFGLLLSLMCPQEFVRICKLCPQMNFMNKDPMAKKESLLADILCVVLNLVNIDGDFYRNNIIEVEPVHIKEFIFGRIPKNS
jgi:hypothetical protein